MYNLSRKFEYLKSEIVKIGRFWAILRLFLDFDAKKGGTVLCLRPRWWVELNIYT